MSEVFEIWIYFLLHGLVFGMTLKGLGKLFVIFSVGTWLWFSVTITYIGMSLNNQYIETGMCGIPPLI